ncbi:MAG: NUDIX hydrolase [Candidatus Obscuribacterales bacterium]|nr:NUDIX hydrolase [Candidatus Obscuribacterales bacterium]
MALYTRKHLLESQKVFSGHIFNVRKDYLSREGSGRIEREIVEHNGGVTIACQPKPGQILLAKQYRYSIDQELFELPAGRVEVGEDRLIAAKRELAEETGYWANNWREFAQLYPAPGFCNELLTLYLATDLEWRGTNPDHDEEIEIVTVSMSEAWQWALAGKITDAKTIAGLALLLFS